MVTMKKPAPTKNIATGYDVVTPNFVNASSASPVASGIKCRSRTPNKSPAENELIGLNHFGSWPVRKDFRNRK